MVTSCDIAPQGRKYVYTSRLARVSVRTLRAPGAFTDEGLNLGFGFWVLRVFTLLDLRVSSLRRGHANLLCIAPISTDDPRRGSVSNGYVM